MISSFFPLKKLRRNGKYLLFGAILVVGVVAVYHEFVAANTWSTHTRVNRAGEGNIWRRTVFDHWAGADYRSDSGEDSAAWRSSYTPQPWKPEFKGQANLHIFEDWCGSSTAQLRKNLHYPLYPHSRTTVQKLAVSPQWTNYGLRIFGYLHPYTDGEFVFAVSSDDNSEFWLSQDDSSLNLQLLTWVGKTGTEWTAPGEFEKYASQTSRPVWLSAQRKYYFEVIHKQNDRGTDHVEVAWKLYPEGLRFMVIESKHISLYTNESTLLMSNVAHIPQTVASHTHAPSEEPSIKADMLREDPRDNFYLMPLINSMFLEGVLPDCSYKPTYIIKGFPLLRYQGLQFVHMSFIYPNDYTRLTHMETENSCFYHENPFYLERFGFARYMRLDHPEGQEREDRVEDFGFQPRDLIPDEDRELKEENAHRGDGPNRAKKKKIDNYLLPDYGDDYDDYVNRRRRKLFSFSMAKTKSAPKKTSDADLHIDRKKGRQGANVQKVVLQPQPKAEKAAEQNVKKTADLLQPKPTQILTRDELWEHSRRELNRENRARPERELKPRPAKKQKVRSVAADGRSKRRNPLVTVDKEEGRPEEKEQPGVKERPSSPSQHPQENSKRRQGLRDLPSQHLDRKTSAPKVVRQRRYLTRPVALQPAVANRSTAPRLDTSDQLNQRDAVSKKSLREREIEMNVPLQQDIDAVSKTTRAKMAREWIDTRGDEMYAGEEKGFGNEGKNVRVDEKDSLWGPGVDSEGAVEEETIYNPSPAPVFDPEVNWSQTFQVNQLDLQAVRSDWIDLQCNVSGNLLLRPSEAQPMVKAYMDKLNQKHHGRFTLVRAVNVEKHLDGGQGSRYLLELELKDVNDQLLRLSHYIYALIRQRGPRSRNVPAQQSAPQVVLCNPLGFHWNPTATVHFIVPVKNQARWVRQLIVDMEELYRKTGDPNFNLIITDYSSTDMDVEKALQSSTLLRYQYVKLSGNFERSAGLQAGINLITDDHSIVFLCDLHIHFPPSIIDTVRKHCVEGRMAFAPIVMRLDCGATPREPRGYWEVNGFGLLGIYKSDLDAAGGMNTREFTNRWGGEDWELLDRILQSGLEVERIYLRNFFHHYHSKRGMWNRRVLANPR